MSPGRFSVLSAALTLLLGAAGALGGCGKHDRAHLQFLRSESEARPLWVAAYFAERESALDGVSVSDLVSRKDEFQNRPGVIEARAFPLAPGDSKPIDLDPLDPKVQWIILAAESDTEDPCRRHTVEIGENRRLNLLIEAEGDCLVVRRMK